MLRHEILQLEKDNLSRGLQLALSQNIPHHCEHINDLLLSFADVVLRWNAANTRRTSATPLVFFIFQLLSNAQQALLAYVMRTISNQFAFSVDGMDCENVYCNGLLTV